VASGYQQRVVVVSVPTPVGTTQQAQRIVGFKVMLSDLSVRDLRFEV